MDYRVLIVSPEKEARTKLVDFVNEHIERKFPKEKFRVEYGRVFEDIRGYLNEIGGAECIGTAGEWFGIFDQRMCSPTLRNSSQRDARLFYDSMEQLVDLVRKICGERDSPIAIVRYEGEFEKEIPKELERKMDENYETILKRWDFLKTN